MHHFFIVSPVLTVTRLFFGYLFSALQELLPTVGLQIPKGCTGSNGSEGWTVLACVVSFFPSNWLPVSGSMPMAALSLKARAAP